MSDPASLSNLRDIALPPAVPLWPPAPGWWVVAAASVAAAAILIVMAVRQRRRNAYRREALRALNAAAPRDISTVLKRAALAAWPRAEVASLSGGAWLAFLDRTGHTTAFTAGPGRAIETLAFGGTVGDVEAVRAAARYWLSHHRSHAVTTAAPSAGAR